MPPVVVSPGDHTSETYIAGLTIQQAWTNKMMTVSAAVLCLLKADNAIPAAKFVAQTIHDLSADFDVMEPPSSGAGGSDDSTAFGASVKASLFSLLCRCYLHVRAFRCL